MTDFLYRQLSGTTFDGVEEVEPGGSLYEIDPVQRELLAWLKAVANNDIGAKGWYNATGGTRLENKLPVEFTLEREPTRNLLRQVEVGYPCLAIWPEQDTTEAITLALEQTTTSWSLLYLLGPLNEAEFAQVGGALRIFAKLVKLMIDNRYHGAHDDGALQLDVGQVNVSSIRMRGAQYGVMDSLGDGQDGVAFHAAKIALETTEVDKFVDGADPEFQGLNIKAESATPEGIWLTAEGRT